MELNDLLIEIKKGNRQAFDQLVLYFYESLNAFAFNILKDKDVAQDIVQDVFVNIWLNRKNITLEESTQSLLYVSTRNLAFNYIRSTKRENNRYQQFIEENDETSISDYVVQEEALRLLNESIEKLPPRMAEVIRLSLAGLKQEEIAIEMNVSVANVKRLKAFAIEKLKKSLGALSCFVLSTTNLLQ